MSKELESSRHLISTGGQPAPPGPGPAMNDDERSTLRRRISELEDQLRVAQKAGPSDSAIAQRLDALELKLDKKLGAIETLLKTLTRK